MCMPLGIQEIRIPISGALLPASGTAGTIGIVNAMSEYPSVKGYIEKVSFAYTSCSGTGSIMLMISGTNEVVYTAVGSANNTAYPRVFPKGNVPAITGSPYFMERFVVNGPLIVSGLALGSPSSCYAVVTYLTP